MTTSRAIVIPALSKKQTATLICFHGLGDSGAGWTFLAENWRRRGKFEDVGFVFPNAPNIPITINGGMRMPGWYDILSTEILNRSEDETGILKTRNYIHSLINQQIADGIPSSRIIVGGFSQGGAMSMIAGPTFREKLAGVFGLSSYQLLPNRFEELFSEAEGKLAGQGKTKIFMGHGEADPMVRLEWGRKLKDEVEKRGYEIEWHQYPNLPHGADPKEIDDLERWVQARLEETNATIPKDEPSV